MELLINDTLRELKSINSKRRSLFVQNVLSFFPPEGVTEEQHKKKVAEEFRKKQEISDDEFEFEFFKSFGEALNASIWSFLRSEDKKEIKKPENLDVSKEENTKFIAWLSKHIEVYAKYVKAACGLMAGEKEDIDVIFAFLAKTYSWTFDQMREMNELDLFKAIEQAVALQERENLERINAGALTAAFASGSKPAKNQIDQMNRRQQMNQWLRKEKSTNPDLRAKTNLSPEQMANIGRANG